MGCIHSIQLRRRLLTEIDGARSFSLLDAQTMKSVGTVCLSTESIYLLDQRSQRTIRWNIVDYVFNSDNGEYLLRAATARKSLFFNDAIILTFGLKTRSGAVFHRNETPREIVIDFDD